MTDNFSMEQFTNITKALSDPHRVRALVALNHGELCACQVIELLGLAPSTVSKHMSILKAAGLVRSRKDGRWIHYSIVDEEKCGRMVWEFVQNTISFLRLDETIQADSEKMKGILELGLEALCKKQKSVIE